MRTILKDPALAHALVALHKAGRITADLLVEAINDHKLARGIVAHEVIHDLIVIPGVGWGSIKPV